MVWGPQTTSPAQGLGNTLTAINAYNPVPEVNGYQPIYTKPSGDASGATDWATLQAALNVGAKGLGVFVGLFPGTYVINSPLIIWDNTWLAGLTGRGAVIIKAAPNMSLVTAQGAATGGMIVNAIQRFGFGGTRNLNIHISDITWDHNGSNQSANANGVAPRFVGTQDLLIERCTFINPKNSLLLIADAADNLTSHFRPIVRDCLFDGTANGGADLIDFGNLVDGRWENNTIQNCAAGNAFSTAFSAGLLIDRCVIKNNATQGLSIQAMNDCKISRCHIYGNGTWGIQAQSNPLTSGGQLENMLDLTIENCSIHNNTNSGILLETASSAGNASYGVNGNTPQRIKIVNCDIYSNGHAAIEFQWADTVLIENNQIYANSTAGAGVWAALHCVTLGTPASQVNTNVTVLGNAFYDDTTPTQTVICNLTQANGWTFTNNQFRNHTTFVSLGSGNATGPYQARNNKGVNPYSQVKATLVDLTNAANSSPVWPGPTTPASATTYTNVSGVDIWLYHGTLGTITNVSVDGITIQGTAANWPILWPAGSTFSVTWSVQPTYIPYGV